MMTSDSSMLHLGFNRVDVCRAGMFRGREAYTSHEMIGFLR